MSARASMGLAILLGIACSRSTAPPAVLYQLPEFQLVNQRGQPFGSAQLAGRIYVASFLFTSCPTVCPRLMERAKTLQRRLLQERLSIQMVSFSVDPETDTPQKLAAYARKHEVDESSWTFLTGPLSAVEKAVRQGFKSGSLRKTALSEKGPRGESLYDIAHGTRFVLVDGRGGLRGFYSSDQPGLSDLIRDIKTLVQPP